MLKQGGDRTGLAVNEKRNRVPGRERTMASNSLIRCVMLLALLGVAGAVNLPNELEAEVGKEVI